MKASPQRWRFRSSTSVWGHIRCLQWGCGCVPPGPGIVIRLRHLHLHTVTRLHREVCRGSAVSFRRRINITAIFLNRHLFFGRVVIPAEQTRIIRPRWDELGPGEKTSWGNRLNLVKFCAYLQTNMLACAAGGGAAAFVEEDMAVVKQLSTNPPLSSSFVAGCFSTYLLRRPYFLMLLPVVLAGCC